MAVVENNKKVEKATAAESEVIGGLDFEEEPSIEGMEMPRREGLLSETLVSQALDVLLKELTETKTSQGEEKTLRKSDSKDSCVVEIGDGEEAVEVTPEEEPCTKLQSPVWRPVWSLWTLLFWLSFKSCLFWLSEQPETVEEISKESTVEEAKIITESAVMEPDVLLQEAQTLVRDQKHLLAFWPELTMEERNCFLKQLRKTNFSDCSKWFAESGDVCSPLPENLAPIPADRNCRKSELSTENLAEYRLKGLEAIANGQVAAVVLAGGQASRLGSDVPKGTLELGIGCAFGDSLFGIQCAKIVALQNMANRQFPEKNGKIHWVVMTSPGTDILTKKHLAKLFVMHNLNSDQLTLICQDEIPAYDMEGKFLLGPNKCSLVTAPNGNGGLFPAMYPELERLEKLGIRYAHVYCVDNILCKVADPTFIGFAIEKNADVVTKTVEKKQGELVGSVCLNNGKACIVEYSELGPELAERKTEDGRYLFGSGSIANHLFTMDFLKIVSGPKPLLPFHRALKKITHVAESGEIVKPTSPNGIKLEQFVFDVFQCSSNFYTWEVRRSDEFSPLKNAESTGRECLSTCRADLAEQNRSWLAAVGITYPEDVKFYFKSLQTYDGEGLLPLRATPQTLRIKDVVVDGSRSYVPKRQPKILKIEKPHEDGQKTEEVF